MTVSIYLGAAKISEKIDPDGIIQMTSEYLENSEKLLSQCSAKDYESRLPAVIDNYERVLEYLNMEDWLYEKYFMDRK